MPDNNPHTAAASAYGTNAQKHSTDPREVEAQVLLKAATMMQDLQQNWNADDFEKIDEALKFNRNVWMMFFDTALENKDGGRPDDLRSNIINLANFIFKRTVDILATPEKAKLDVLISINREIAAGLMMRPQVQTAANRGSTGGGREAATSA